MPYATVEEFEEEVGLQETVELTNLDDPSATTVNSDRLNKALLAASGEINSYLATRYQIPVDPVPSILKSYCIDIAWYRLAQNNAPEAFAKRYDNAIARLKDIEKGVMQLVLDDGTLFLQRPVTNQLIDDRGQLLNDWTASYIPGGEAVFTEDRLRLY
ncbi:gp436 family protein [Nostoc sp.]|uniref:gp436 family protein n=1 Tax=Nostoc sp. TaxID=1180 RepID=UPI002FF468C2